MGKLIILKGGPRKILSIIRYHCSSFLVLINFASRLDSLTKNIFKDPYQTLYRDTYSWANPENSRGSKGYLSLTGGGGWTESDIFSVLLRFKLRSQTHID